MAEARAVPVSRNQSERVPQFRNEPNPAPGKVVTLRYCYLKVLDFRAGTSKRVSHAPHLSIASLYHPRCPRLNSAGITVTVCYHYHYHYHYCCCSVHTARTLCTNLVSASARLPQKARRPTPRCPTHFPIPSNIVKITVGRNRNLQTASTWTCPTEAQQTRFVRSQQSIAESRP